MAGIYIHIPFCKQKCSYCDFHFSTTFEAYRSKMMASIANELEQRVDYLQGKPVETIYFGGGTPSLLTEDELVKLLATVKRLFTVVAPEITLEANPDDCTEHQLAMWKRAGINRLSIGLQSFKASDLEWMNRAHTAEESSVSVERAIQFGFDNITVDLMYGLPQLSHAEWKNHIQMVLDWGVPHVSSYCLTVEQKTALHHLVETEKITVANEEMQSEQFEILVQMLEDNGLMQYEISNFSKTGFESRHNSNYWKGAWYLGVGPSAHSFNGRSRRWNVANNSKYIQSLKDGTRFFEDEVLTKEDQFNELILTGLRTTYGVPLNKLEEIQPISESFWKKKAEFQSFGWMQQEEDTIVLTREGRLKADYIASELFV